MTLFRVMRPTTLKAVWEIVSEDYPPLAQEKLGTRTKIRFASAVAVFGYQCGRAQPSPRKKGQEASDSSLETAGNSETVSKIPNCQKTNSRRAAVIIPAFTKESKQLAKLRSAIVAVREQTTKPCRFYLVDDGSPVPIEKQLSEEEKQGVTILRLDENSGPGAARNEGLKAARAVSMDVVCFTDSDCCPSPSWVETIVGHFIEHPSDDIVGGITHSVDSSPYTNYYQDVYGTVNGRLLADGTLLYATTCNMGVRLSSVTNNFKTLFTEAAGEDVDFCFEAKKSGAVVKLLEKAVVAHDFNSSIRDVFRQNKRYGRCHNPLTTLYPDFPIWMSESSRIPSVKRI